MTNDELREKLWEVEKELAESKRVVEDLIRERLESQRVVSAIMPFLPEIREKIMAVRFSNTESNSSRC